MRSHLTAHRTSVPPHLEITANTPQWPGLSWDRVLYVLWLMLAADDGGGYTPGSLDFTEGLMLFWCITSKVISHHCSTKRRGRWRSARFAIWSQMTRWLYWNFYKEQHSNPPISSPALGWTHQGLLPWLLLGYLHTSRLSPELRLSGCFPTFLSKLLPLFISLPDSPPLMMNERWPECRADGYWCSTISTPMRKALVPRPGSGFY